MDDRDAVMNVQTSNICREGPRGHASMLGERVGVQPPRAECKQHVARECDRAGLSDIDVLQEPSAHTEHFGSAVIPKDCDALTVDGQPLWQGTPCCHIESTEATGDDGDLRRAAELPFVPGNCEG